MKRFKIFITKFLILIIMFLITVIITKKDNSMKLWIKNNLLTSNFSFEKYKSIYLNKFGNIIPNYIEPVFNEKLEYEEINKYKDGISLKVKNNYLVPNLYDGVVVFIGDKDEYKNSVIVESKNITILYSNITSNVKLYDEIKKGELLGESLDNKIYLVFMSDGKIVEYKEYIK